LNEGIPMTSASQLDFHTLSPSGERA